MTVTIPGYSTITGKPETILKLIDEARVITVSEHRITPEHAESTLRLLAEGNLIIIKEEGTS